MIPSPVLIDAGPLVAMLSTKDEHHQRCIEQSGELPETLFSCWPAITEAAYLLKGPKASKRFFLASTSEG